MATPTSLPAAVSTGDVGTAAQFNNLRGAFRILQVVQGTTTTVALTTSGTYADTGLTASITPQSSTSKILVIVSQSVYTSASVTGANIRIDRSGTTIATAIDQSYGSSGGVSAAFSITYLDSPATTSALTYKTTFARNGGAGTVYTQVNNNIATITLLEISA